MHGVDWKTYGALRELLDSPGIDASAVVSGLDFAAMEEFVKVSDQHAAVKAFRDRLRAPARE
jgi:hypothetical protein